MYIVISKPKRISAAAGFSHFMLVLLEIGSASCGMRIRRVSASALESMPPGEGLEHRENEGVFHGFHEAGQFPASMMGMQQAPPPDPLYPPAEPWAAGWLPVGDGHRLYHEQCGQPEGPPLLFLHGGPGSGCSPRHRQLFDLNHFRVVLFDQRGCGRSQPRGSVQANTSAHLVADIERLRQHLGIDRWLVVGGSWGAGLALAYAAAHPAACAGLVLRGVFLGRPSDLDWFFQQARALVPAAWDALAELAPPAARGDLLGWLHQGLQGEQALRHAAAWEAWEASLAQRQPVPARTGLTPDEAVALVDKYRVQSHYLTQGCFWGETDLLMRARGLGAVPAAILHGRLDTICRPQAAQDLHQQLPGSRLQWVEGCGHSPFEPAMARALAQVVRHHAEHGNFVAWGEEGSVSA
jgi:proline iminopeptidase